MDLKFDTSSLEKEFSSESLLTRRYGQRGATLITRRINQFRAAVSLEDMRFAPGARCHELSQNRAGQLAVDLVHPYRLIFVPFHEPIPRKPDGGLDWSQVTSIKIIEVLDYH